MGKSLELYDALKAYRKIDDVRNYITNRNDSLDYEVKRTVVIALMDVQEDLLEKIAKLEIEL